MYGKRIKNLREGFDFSAAVKRHEKNKSNTRIEEVKNQLLVELQNKGLAFLKQTLQYDLNCKFNYNRITKKVFNNINVYEIISDRTQLINDNKDVWEKADLTNDILLRYHNIFGEELISEESTTDPIADSDEMWLSKDRGMMILKHRHAYSRWTLTYIFYTGEVNYKKKKNKELVKDKIPNYFLDYVFKKNLGDNLQKLYNIGFTQIPDSSGYPQLVTVIQRNREYWNGELYWQNSRFPSLFYDKDGYYEYKFRKNWEKLPDSNNPEILCTKRSKDGLLIMGTVMPYDFRKQYKDKNWMFFDYKYARRELDREEIISSAVLTTQQLNDINTNGKTKKLYKPEITRMLGIYAYRLSDKGKQLYDQALEIFGDKGSISVKKIGEWIESQLEEEDI